MLDQLSFKGQWRQYQQRVLDKSESFMDDGKIHLVAAPGSGRSPGWIGAGCPQSNWSSAPIPPGCAEGSSPPRHGLAPRRNPAARQSL